MAIRIWQLMGRNLDWSALPLLAEIYGVPDLEELIVQLAAMRDFDWPKQQ